MIYEYLPNTNTNSVIRLSLFSFHFLDLSHDFKDDIEDEDGI